MGYSSLSIGFIFSSESVDQINRCLRSILLQTESLNRLGLKLDFVLVRTPKAKLTIPMEVPGVVIDSGTENIAVNRNLILENCKAELLYMTDPDCVQNHEAIVQLCSAANSEFVERQHYAFAGPNILTSGNLKLNQFFQFLGKARFLNGGSAQLVTDGLDRDEWHSPTCHILYICSQIRGQLFSESCFDVGEDLDFHFRLKKTRTSIRVINAASVSHEQAPSLRNYLNKIFRYGKAQTRLLLSRPRSFSNRRLLPTYFLVAVLILEFITPEILIVEILAILFVGFFVFEYFRCKSEKRFFYFLGAIMLLHASYLLGQIWGLLSPSLKIKSAKTKMANT